MFISTVIEEIKKYSVDIALVCDTTNVIFVFAVLAALVELVLQLYFKFLPVVYIHFTQSICYSPDFSVRPNFQSTIQLLLFCGS